MEINVPTNLQESVGANPLSQVSIVMHVLMDIGILEQMNTLDAKFVIATRMAQQMKSATSLMEVVFAQMGTMENNANLSVSVKTAQMEMFVMYQLVNVVYVNLDFLETSAKIVIVKRAQTALMETYVML